MPSKTAEKKEQKKVDVLASLLAGEADIEASIPDYPDRIKAGLSNVLSAIGQLKDALYTEQSLEREERDRGFAEKKVEA